MIPLVAAAHVGAYQARLGLEGIAAVTTLALAALTFTSLFWAAKSAGLTLRDVYAPAAKAC
jgi:hypothetical protein